MKFRPEHSAYIIICSLFTILYSLFPVHCNAQRNEFGVFGGVSYYLGDLNPGRQFWLSKPAFGALYRHNFDTRFAYRLALSYGRIQGDDAKTKYNTDRNLSFKSPLFECANLIEFNFMKFEPGNMGYPFSPYIFFGLSVFYFNPMAEYNGKWYDLQPLGTEGQGTSEYPDRSKYSRVSVAIPFGAGFKINLTKLIVFSLEWGMRRTYTDYLDDVSTTYADPKVLTAAYGNISAVLADRSLPVNDKQVIHTGLQRGKSSTNDWFSFAGAVITFKLKNREKVCDLYEKRFNYKNHKR